MIMYAEVRKDGQWHKVGREFISTYDELDGQLTDRVFDGRNKDLISFLCAQSWTGMPKDASKDIKNNKNFNPSETHFATLRELLDFEWDKEIYDIGYISEWQYKRLVNDGTAPSSIIRDPFRASNMVVSQFLMDVIIDNPSLRQDVRYFVEYQHNKCKMKHVSDFFCNESIPGLINLIPEGGSTNDVRIVFSI